MYTLCMYVYFKPEKLKNFVKMDYLSEYVDYSVFVCLSLKFWDHELNEADSL